MSEATIFATIKSMVANNELKDAIELLENTLTDKRLVNELALQKAKLNEVRHQQLNDLISIELANRERSKVRYALLGIIDNAQQEEQDIPEEKSFLGRQAGLMISLLLVALLGGTIAYLFFIKQDKSKIDEPTTNEHPVVVDTLEKKKDQSDNTLKNIAQSTTQNTVNEAPKTKKITKVPNQESGKSIDEETAKADLISYPKIRGRVLDENDKGVKGVRVIVEDVEVLTDQLGRFSIALTAAKGTYAAKAPLLLEYMLDSTYYESTDVFIGDNNLVLRIEK